MFEDSLKFGLRKPSQPSKRIVVHAPASKFFRRTSQAMYPAGKENRDPLPPTLALVRSPRRGSGKGGPQQCSIRVCLLKIRSTLALTLRPSSRSPGSSLAGSPPSTSRAGEPPRRRLYIHKRHRSFGSRKEEKRVAPFLGPGMSDEARMWVEMRKDAEDFNVQSGCLEKHDITTLCRARMADWMIEVISAYQYTRRCFFLACAIMDNYLRVTSHCYTDDDIHLLGVISIYIASKIEEIKPLFLDEVHTSVVHKMLSVSTMKLKEREMIQTLDFRLIYTTALQIIEFIMYVVGKSDPVLFSKNKAIISRVKDESIRLAILAQHEYAMLRHTPVVLAVGTIKAAVAKLGVGGVVQANIVGLIKTLLGEDWKTQERVKMCAEDLLRLEKEFSARYNGMVNVHICVMLP